MSETIVYMQLDEQGLKNLQMPKPLLGMEEPPVKIDMDEFSYAFESDGGDFIEFFFDIAYFQNWYFVVVKMVANKQEILDAYTGYYKSVASEYPVDYQMFKRIDRKFVTRLVFKEHDPDLLKFFSEKRKGEYRGLFVEKKPQ